ncbi:MAG: hypothetical protein WC408_04715 [Candidatus Micrarchaeia archaeon]|jgi:hypothetical protein
MVKVSPRASGISEEVQEKIQKMHDQGMHPAAIANTLKKENPTFSRLNEKITRKYINFDGDKSKKFDKTAAGLGIIVTPSKKFLEMMEKLKSTHSASGISFTLGIPEQMARAFIIGEMDEKAIKESRYPDLLKKEISKMSEIIRKNRE